MKQSIELMIKPASGDCNLKCRYCFYADTQKNRQVASHGIMEIDVLDTIVEKVFASAKQNVSFSFQGGEPTLAGLGFYRRLKEMEEKHNKLQLPVCHTIQTNGWVLDDSWASFFSENNYLVGLSIDGTEATHDQCRVTPGGEGTHEIVMEKVDLLREHGVEFNVLTVVTGDVAQNARDIYAFYKAKGLLYQQYIPCIAPFGMDETGGYALTADLYGQFLMDLFDCWYKDIKSGEFIYNRYFENLVGVLKGYRPEVCGMSGYCLDQYVVESDGSVYPCDFYVLDQYKLGNLTKDSFEELDEKRKELQFVEQSNQIHEDCKNCKWLRICRGGCRRDREQGDFIGSLGTNRYCDSYKAFFPYVFERLRTF